MLAWILERWVNWSDNGGDVETVFSKDDLCTHATIYCFLESDRAGWYQLVNLTAHDRGGHFIPWEIPDRWVDDLRRTFRGRRQTD